MRVWVSGLSFYAQFYLYEVQRNGRTPHQPPHREQLISLSGLLVLQEQRRLEQHHALVVRLPGGERVDQLAALVHLQIFSNKMEVRQDNL